MGSLYLSKAILTAGPEPFPGADGGPGASASTWAAKAADRFEQAAAAVDRENAARHAVAGDRSVPDLGTPVLFVDLGLARLYAGRPGPALEAFTRARSIAPWDAEAAQNAAVAELALGRAPDAIVSALEALLLEPRRQGLGEVLQAAYAKVDPGGCGVVSASGQLRIQWECPALRPFACAAITRLAAALRERPTQADDGREMQLARLAREAASLGCPLP
jgi:hypothetical protein